MSYAADDHEVRAHGRFELLVVVVAAVVALISARPHAGSWNDASRLAAVESLVDHGTLSIDDSIYVRVPEGRSPYDPADPQLNKDGTKDKLWIDGHYYSDKPMVQSLAMGGVYWVVQSITGLKAGDDPALFGYWMTVLSSGAAYVVAAWALARISGIVGLDFASRSLFMASFLFATAALPYVRHVNQHIVLLAIALLVALQMFRLARPSVSSPLEPSEPSPTGRSRGEDPLATFRSWPQVVFLGFLAGLGYTIDLGTGPILALYVVGYAFYKTRSWASVLVVLFAMAPSVLVYHVVNYSIGGSMGPANANPEYLAWPGSPFDADSATGSWKHDSPVGLVGYSLELLVGTRGFLLHNLPVLLLLAAAGLFLRRRTPFRVELATLFAWAVLTWIAYSTGSNNRSGACYSIRWFVPLLAAAYPAMAVLLRERPHLRVDLAILTVFGSCLAVIGWWQGPWMLKMVPGYWVFVGLGLAAWVWCAFMRIRRAPMDEPSAIPLRSAA